MAKKPSSKELQEKITILEQKAATRIQAMISLERDHEQYRSLIENSRDIIHSVRPDGSFIYTNQTWKDTLGYNDEDLKTLKIMDIVDKGCRDQCKVIFAQLINGVNIERNETTFLTKDGKKIIVEGQCTTHFENGKATRMTGFFRDISDRTRQEQALRESEIRYRDLFENAHDIIQIVHPDGKLLYVNDSWRQTFGYKEDEIDTLSIFDIISPDCQGHCQATFTKVITEQKTHYINTVFVDKNGKKVIIEGNAICKFEDGTPLYTQCIFRDITEKKKMEEELIKTQKLESVGIFAGGIAHDFNNLLQAIIGNISLAKMHLNAKDKAYALLKKTEKASLLAQNLTQQLLTFSKGGDPIKSVTAIDKLLEEASSFSLRGSNVKCEYEMETDLWPAEVDKGQLGQVAQNLAINASQAMPDGGILTISASNSTIAENEIFNLPGGKYIKITFHDQGSGISEENIAKIFDPYFSSKKKGSGLGLAITYSIISNHGGQISVDSKLGKGSTFTIYLPAAATNSVMAHEDTTTKQTSQHHGRFLLLDDEELIIEILRDMLEFLGCTTDAVSDGCQAVELYGEAMKKGTPYAGVIMDLTIPGGMGGKETMVQLQQIDPHVKAIVSSGYANDPIMANFRKYGFCAVVPKPYTVEDLSQALSALFAAQ